MQVYVNRIKLLTNRTIKNRLLRRRLPPTECSLSIGRWWYEGRKSVK